MSEVHKLLHLGREGELQWIRERVEQLTGERYSGHEDFLKTVRIRYIRKFYFYLLVEVIRKRKRRKKIMQNINWITLVPALLGAVKLVLQPFGVEISDQNINEIANGAAALATVIGVVMSHRKQEATTTNGSTISGGFNK